VLFGSFEPSGQTTPHHPGLYNAAYLAEGGDLRRAAVKRLLPVYDVFYEPRWFTPGEHAPPLLEVGGRKVGVLVCEDMWDEGYPATPSADLLAAGADLLVCLSASPYRVGTLDERLRQARRGGAPLAFCNMVGATDELIFDGQSFAITAEGARIAQGPAFAAGVTVVDFAEADPISPPPTPKPAELFAALTFGLRTFARKNGLRRGVVGLSGGIDSAVTAVIAANALEEVTAVAMPSRHTDERSTQSARELADALGIPCEVYPIEGLHSAAESALPDLTGTAAENVQARLRMMILMSLVNQRGGMVVNTSNKTELALGYSTLYGDMAGAISPLGDLTKLEVIALAEWINTHRTPIPTFTRERPPSAELAPDQVDPFDYDEVSPAVEAMVQANQSSPAMQAAEHKRWQMGVILKVSDKAFGTGRMVPISRE
jgi:NAD+ synthase (glutamine-hydrolysing)